MCRFSVFYELLCQMRFWKIAWMVQEITLPLCYKNHNKNRKTMKKFLILLMMLLPLQMYAGTTSVDAQAEKVVDVKLEKGNC